MVFEKGKNDLTDRVNKQRYSLLVLLRESYSREVVVEGKSACKAGMFPGLSLICFDKER